MKIMNFDEINDLAKNLAKKLENGGCVGLIGDLGAGKTTFTKKICKYFGVTENVKSPTFTYVIEYESGRKKLAILMYIELAILKRFMKLDLKILSEMKRAS